MHAYVLISAVCANIDTVNCLHAWNSKTAHKEGIWVGSNPWRPIVFGNIVPAPQTWLQAKNALMLAYIHSTQFPPIRIIKNVWILFHPHKLSPFLAEFNVFGHSRAQRNAPMVRPFYEFPAARRTHKNKKCQSTEKISSDYLCLRQHLDKRTQNKETRVDMYVNTPYI